MPTYLETVDDNSTQNCAFDITGGSARASYIITSASALDLQGVITDILGYTDPLVQNGRRGLGRSPPRVHPKFPYLYASRISSIVGLGSATAARTTPVTPALDALNTLKPMADFLGFQQYRVDVEFTGPRPYAIIGNEAFTGNVQGSWTKPDGSSQSFTYSPEFVRYNTWSFVPLDNNVQGSQGSMSMRKNGAWITYTSPPWTLLPDSLLTFKWVQVPLRLILSNKSLITAWRGRVNQNPILDWGKGSLLYMNYSFTPYGPPTGTTQTITGISGLYNYVNWAQLCDVEFTFLQTSRTISGSVPVVTNANYVVGGHNLMLDLVSNEFYYSVRNNSSGNADLANPPAFFSAPLEAMWSDCDSGGGPDRV